MKRRFFDTALRQSAADVGCQPEDFFRPENTFYPSARREGAKVFYPEQVDFLAVSFGFGSAVSVREDRLEEVSDALRGSYINSEALMPLGLKPKFECVFFLPSGDEVAPLPCRYETRLLLPEDFGELYLPEWSNALCSKSPQNDRIAVGAYDRGKLVGLAGASQDAENMMQIGIDVLKEYRRQGIAAALTSALANEIIKIGQAPFYSCNWNNLLSFKNALRSGFTPVWTEIQANLAG